MASCAWGKNSQNPQRIGFSKVVLSPFSILCQTLSPNISWDALVGFLDFPYFRGLLLCSVDQCLLAFGKRGMMAAGLSSLSTLRLVLGMQYRILRTKGHIVLVHTRIASELLPIGIRCRLRDFGGGSGSAWI